MADSRTIQVTLKAVADMSDVTSNVKQIQNVLSQLKLPPGLKGNFEKVFNGIEQNVIRASQAMANGFKTKGDLTTFTNAMNNINNGLIQLQTNMSKISHETLQQSLTLDPSLQGQLDAYKQRIQEIETLLHQGNNENAFAGLSTAITDLQQKVGTGTKSVENFVKSFQSGDLNSAEAALKKLQATVAGMRTKLGEDFGGSQKWKDYAQDVDVFAKALEEAKTRDQDLRIELEQTKNASENLGTGELDKLIAKFEEITGIDLGKLIEEFKRLKDAEIEAGDAQQKVNSELDQLKSRISYFFGMTNAVMLFRRALRSTFETVKDLDKVMTETAVVTEFDVGDMWSQLPEYTERANQLGVSIHDAYEAATLYYQQGLSTNEVMAVSNETLKMARIAGLDAAEATDRMTNALRGFNMEITEANAQNINDVYSNLAAKTASNVDEISTAMTKVASLAHNANMSFENTAAFLSQIIETTRESAETAGTALKTVIARFSEVKKLYSTGDLLGTDEEGEEINVNKVSAALRTAGINLNEYLTGMKGLDDIFMELSEKWDSLDQVQQRYIATMAAGSRQQSRFIALMQDNARMTELVSYANNAAGASQKQFEKTLESLESKLNELKNSWNTFLMGIANSDIIKVIVDALTGLFNNINNLTASLPGLGKSIANITIAVTAFTVARALLGKTFGPIATLFKKETSSVIEGTKVIEANVASTNLALNKLSAGLVTAGSLLMIFSSRLDDGTEAGKQAAKNMRNLGIILASLGGGLKIVTALTKIFKIQIVSTSAFARVSAKSLGEEVAKAGIKAQLGWGWIAAAALLLTGLVAGVVYLYNRAKKASPEGKLKAAQKATQEAKEVAQQAKESYDALNSSIDSLKEQYSTIDTLTQGTKEWKEAVKETNEKVLELIGSYKQLGNYVTLENGVLKIDFENEAVQGIIEDSYKASVKSSVVDAMAQRQEYSANMDVLRDKADVKRGYYTYGEDYLGNRNGDVADLWEGREKERDLLARALAKDAEAIEQIQQVYKISAKELSDPTKYAEDFIEKLDFSNLPQFNGWVESISSNYVKDLTEYGVGLVEAAENQEYYNNQISTGALILSNLNDEQKRYGENYLNKDRIENIYQEVADQLDKELSDATNLPSLHKEFAEAAGYLNYEEYKQKNNNEDVDPKVLKPVVIASRVVDETTKKVENFGNELEDMPDRLKRVYEKSEGNALNYSDVQGGLEQFFAELSGIPVELIHQMPALEDVFKEWLNSEEGKDATQAYNFAGERFGAQKERLSKAGIQLDTEQFGALESGQVEALVNKLLSVVSSSGPGIGQELTDEIGKILSENIPEEFRDSFLTELNNLDWNDINAVDAFRAHLEEMGIVLKGSDKDWDDFINKIKEGADSINKFDLSALEGQFDNLVKIRKEIEKDKNYTLSEDEYNAVVAAYAAAGQDISGDFVKDENDKYQYIGGSMEDLAAALKENTNAVLQGARDQLNSKIGVKDILSNETLGLGVKSSEDLNTLETSQKRALLNNIINGSRERGIDLSSLGIEGLSNQSTWSSIEAAGKTDEILSQILTAVVDIDLEAEKEAQGRTEAQMTARNNTAQENASMVNTEYGDEYIKALEAQAYAAGIDAKEIEGLTIALESENAVEKVGAAQRLANLVDIQKEIELYGLDAQAVSDYAKQLMAADSSLDLSTAKSQAVTLTRLNRGLESLTDSYDKWIELVDDSGRIVRKFGTKSESTFKDLKDAIKDIADVGDELPDTFLEDANNVELLKQAIEGDTEALKQLQVAAREAAAENYVIDAGLNTDEFNNQFNEFANWCAEVKLPDLEAGAYLNDQSYLDGLYNILQASGATADQIKAFFDSLGFDIEYERVPITASAPTYGPASQPAGPDMAPQIIVTGTQTIPSTMTVPKPKFRYKGTTPGNIAAPTPRSTGSCFVAGTLVTTFSGLRPIESIQAGDIVLSYNERTHQNEYSVVLQTMIHDVTENIYTLHIENNILEVTGIHRFYIIRNNKKSWISVQDFQENDLVQFADGTLHRIEKIEVEVRTTRVYNFEVSNNHNYYVGENQVLAHNKGGCFAAGTLVTLQGFYKNIEQVSVGDVVLSYNEQKKKNEYSTVVQTMVHLVKEKIYTLYIERDKLVVTGIHRFYITREDKASWIPAEELCVGDKVRFADGTLHDITKISVEEKSLIVYNFEVSNTHNYYVGRSQILAHNKGGGGSGGGKSDTWENPFDELFNLQEKINGAMRKRNVLQSKFNDLLNSSKTTTSDLRKNYDSQLKNLRRQLSLEKSMLNGRKKQLKNAGNEKYEGKTYKNWGVTKYGSFNYDTGELKINWKALEKLSGKTDKDSVAKGKAAEAYINYLQELADKYNESNDNIREMKEEIREWHKENLNTVTEFEDKVKEAYIEGREKEIDALEEMFDAIEESTQNVIDGIREQIDLQRQARENDKTEQELADKEVRLAYLQRDTSGANQAEIMSLQKEIDEARQDYEDSLIDQTIDQMSKDADLAAEQRAQQIEIMRQQLDKDIENGDIWKDVNNLLNTAFNKDGTVNKNSELFKLLRESSGYAGMSKDQKTQFNQETSEELMQAQAALYDTRREQMSKSQQNAVATTILKGTKKNNYYGWGSGKTRKSRLTTVFGSQIANYILDRIDKKKTSNVKNYDNYKYSVWKDKIMKYKTGGLADFTGPAWLDGTKSKPEIILNAADSKNLIVLKDVLSSLLNGKSSPNKDNGGDNYFDIDITAELKNDYDVDQLAARIKKQIQQDGQYRNVNAISFLR